MRMMSEKMISIIGVCGAACGEGGDESDGDDFARHGDVGDENHTREGLTSDTLSWSESTGDKRRKSGSTWHPHIFQFFLFQFFS